MCQQTVPNLKERCLKFHWTQFQTDGLVQNAVEVIMIKTIILLVCMLVISIEDARCKSVPVWQLGAMLLAFGMYMWIFQDANIENMVAGIMIGLFLIFISRATGWIGVGDGIVIGIVCAFMGWLFVTQMFIIAVTLMSLTSMLLLMFKVVKMKYEIPFIPYMFLSAMGVLACG